MDMLVTQTQFPGVEPAARGKVRDIYDLGDQLIIVATDRISAFDVILDDPIPDKGKVLNGLSTYWFQVTKEHFPNHLVSENVADFPEPFCHYSDVLEGRSMLVRKGLVIPVECIVRGYLSGSGWKDYQKTGKVQGISLPAGLTESARLPEPIFTPTTKAAEGHDQPLTEEESIKLLGQELYSRLKDISIQLYLFAAKHAEEADIIIADTKYEFAWINGEIYVVDELFTPDNSRFWPMSEYKPGGPQPSYDKQFIRDYLESIDWNKQPPSPELPQEVIDATREKYLEAFRRITGKTLFTK
ncbi:MAG TPA: phosphoribosylaminoimidazolesuccinocarboxamide synthase [Bacillota bacterium]|nr:phosphoribosylaminoimidazolesuccinocarboxamide synthase [Bacillota bacterium]